MQAHHNVAADDQQQAGTDNSLWPDPVGQKSKAELPDGVEQAVSKDDVGQLNTAKSGDAGQERKDDAEIFPAQVKARVGDPCDCKDLALTGN